MNPDEITALPPAEAREILVKHEGHEYTIWYNSGLKIWAVSEDGLVLASLEQAHHGEWKRHPGLREVLLMHLRTRLMVYL